jgi:regulatory protein
MSDETQIQKVYEKAVKLLGIRAHTSFDLKRKLQMKGFNREVVEEVIGRLIKERYLNDEMVALNYIESLINYKSYGFYGILTKLKQKGIDKGMAEKILAEKMDLETEEKIAKKFLLKNKSTGSKAAAALKRKGFRTHVIFKVVDLNDYD